MLVFFKKIFPVIFKDIQEIRNTSFCFLLFYKTSSNIYDTFTFKKCNQKTVTKALGIILCQITAPVTFVRVDSDSSYPGKARGPGVLVRRPVFVSWSHLCNAGQLT